MKPDSEKHGNLEGDDDDSDEEDAELERIREMVKQWKAEAARQGRPLKLPTSRCLVLPHRLVLSLESVPFMLRNIWTAGLLLFATVMGSTFFITAVWQVSGRRGRCQTDRLIGYDRYRSRRYLLGHRLLGVSVPSLCIDDLADSTAAVRSRKYIQSHGDPTDERDASRSIIMEVRRSILGWGPSSRGYHQFLKEMDQSSNSSKPTRGPRPPNTAPPKPGPQAVAQGFRPLHARAASNPSGAWRSNPNSPARFEERTPLSRSYSTADIEDFEESLEYKGSGPVAGGTIMGIHNLAIVFPQFIVCNIIPTNRFSDRNDRLHWSRHSSSS